MDEVLLHKVFQQHHQVVVVEDGVRHGGPASALQAWAQDEQYSIPITALGIDDCFVPHGKTEILYDNQGLTPERLIESLDQIVSKKEG